MRVPHYLKPNKGCEGPQHLIFVDTETRERRIRKGAVSHHLRFGWACYVRREHTCEWSEPEWARFSSRAAFWKWVEGRVRPKTRVYLFAHNWSFDGPVLGMFSELPARGWVLTRAVIEGPPVMLTWRKEDATIQVLDTLNWWRVSLSVLGESLGVAKLKMPGHSASLESWDTYCRRDVDVIRTAVLKWLDFLRTNDLGGFASTLAGQAMRTYRHRFMSHDILIDDDEDALRLARASYFGGRVECFRLGSVKGPVYCLDVNSMYPFVMAQAEYPTALEGVSRKVSLRDLRRLLQRYAVVADVDLETKEPAYPHVVGERLCFPVGRFRATLTTPDLLRLQSKRGIRRIRQIALYRKAPLFREYVEKLVSYRLQAIERGDLVGKEFYKRMLNSLYGKFGQRGGKWVEHSRTDDLTPKVWTVIDADARKVMHFRQLAGVVQVLEGDTESRESHPAIASHVTAYAREYLWRLIRRAGRQNVYYCDTDSLWVSGAGFDRLRTLTHPTRLGALKLEAKHNRVTLFGPKDYRTPNGWKAKGIRQVAERLSEGVYRQDRWSSLRGLLRRGDVDAPTTEKVVKRLARKYQKGTPLQNGHVLPLALREW